AIATDPSQVGDWNNNLGCGLCTYHKKAHPDDWQDRVKADAVTLYSDKADLKDLQQTLKSYAKKDYNYRCNEEPLDSLCDKKVWRTRKYGVGSEKAADTAALHDLNERYFVSQYGGKVRVYQHHRDEATERNVLDSLSFDDFQHLYDNQGGMGRRWLMWPHRRQ